MHEKSRPNTRRLSIKIRPGLEPALLTIHVGRNKVLVRLGQIKNAFNQTDQTHDHRPNDNQRTQNTYQEHDHPLFRITKNELVNAKASKKDTTCPLLFSFLLLLVCLPSSSLFALLVLT